MIRSMKTGLQVNLEKYSMNGGTKEDDYLDFNKFLRNPTSYMFYYGKNSVNIIRHRLFTIENLR